MGIKINQNTNGKKYFDTICKSMMQIYEYRENTFSEIWYNNQNLWEQQMEMK